MTSRPVRRVLVIRLGGLSEFVLAFPAFSAIRHHHPEAHLTLLTTAPFREIARKSGWFDEIWDDGRPRWTRPGKVWALVRRLRRSGADLVYDLENTDRTARYRKLMSDVWGNKAPWSRSVADDGAGMREHLVEQYVRQLAEAGITEPVLPDLSWLSTGFGGRFGLTDGYVLMAPGGSPDWPGRRWPLDRYADLARRIGIEGRRPVLVGTASDAEVNRRIAAASPEAMDLTGRTSLFDLAALAGHAGVAVGNNNGAMHLIAAVGCPAVVLFADESEVKRMAPRGHYVVPVRSDDLATLPVTEVAAAMRLR